MTVRVLHVAQSSEYGLGRYLDALLAAEHEHGWQVVMAGAPTSELRPWLEARHIPWIEWVAEREPGPSVRTELRALRRILNDVAPDVVHLHSSKAGLVGRLALRRQLPTLFQPHAWSFFGANGMKRTAATQWERLGARWADVVVCGSEAERSQGVGAGVAARSWRVVPNAVDTDRFSPGPPEEREPGLVVCAARLAIAQKGQDVLLEAWPAVSAAVPHARLVLIGEGEDRGRLEATAPPSVELPGGSHDMPGWFRRADLVVAPSRYETLSLTVLEALACERAVVTSDAVGMREAVGDCGAVVPIGDADALAEAIVTRLLDPDLARDEGRRGRERVVQRYSLPAWRDGMLEVTDDAARRRS